ncbi:unnamed protein product [Penicillium viridicatum]
MPRLTRSIPPSAPTEPSAPEQSIFAHGLASAILKDSDSPHLRQDGLERSPSPNYHADSDSSDDDAVDIPYRNDEDGSDVRVGVTRRTKPSAANSADKPDPGPSVRDRTTAELEAIMEAQVEDPSIPGLDSTGLPLLRNFMTAFEKKFRDMHPKRTELDWKKGVRRPARSAVARRAAQGQLCGVEAPADQKCTACAKGKGTFEHCRIVFAKNQAQWDWACPDLFPNVPEWVIAAVTERQPSSPLLHTYYGAKDTAAARMYAKLTTSRKRPATTPEDADEKQPPRLRKLELGRAKASEGIAKETPKRRKSEVGPTGTSEGATKDAPPKLKNGGLPFNATWYNSPLEDPKVYRMKDKAYALDTYRDLADIIARATEDHDRMKAALLKKGFLPESDDEESEEENVFAVE